MASLNKVTLIGKLGEDPKKEFLTDGKQVVKFSLATTESWKDKNTGEKKEQTEWHRVVIWNEKLGDLAINHLRKGVSVYIEGTLNTRKWKDKSGVDKQSTEVVLPRFGGGMVLLGFKKDQDFSPAVHPATPTADDFLDDDPIF